MHTPTPRSLGSTVNGRRLKRLPVTNRGAVNRERTGREAMSEEEWEKAQAREKQLRICSIAVAEAIERAGGVAFRRAPEPTEINMATLKERSVSRAFRNNNCIPAVMMANTRAVSRDLVAYVSQHKVSGTTIVIGCDLHPMSVLADVIESMARVVSRMAHHIARKYRVDVIFANTEVTGQRGRTGELVFHVHCHVILDHGRLPPPSFAALVKDIKERAPSNYARVEAFEAGNSAQSLARYCIAPELFSNLAMTDSEILAFSNATRGKKFYRPLGGFKAWRKHLEPEKTPIFVIPNPADTDRLSIDDDGSLRERPRRPPLIVDLGRGWRRDVLQVLRGARQAASAYEKSYGSKWRDTRDSILAEALQARLDAPSLRMLVRRAIGLVRSRDCDLAVTRRSRRFAVVLQLVRLLHGGIMQKPRTRSTKAAERVVILKDDMGRESTARFSPSTPKPIWFESRRSVPEDIVVHHAIAAPRDTRRMAPAILVAFRSQCSVVALLIARNLVQEHFKAMALWNARCTPQERVPVAPELVRQVLVVDGHRVGSLLAGRWVANDGAAYRSEYSRGRVFIFDVPAEKRLVGNAQAFADKGLMTHTCTNSSQPREAISRVPPRGNPQLSGPLPVKMALSA